LPEPLPAFSISQITTVTASFADDLEAYRTAGADAIGIWELKLGEQEDARALEQLEASGLGSASAIPLIPSILPLPLMDGPTDPHERVEAICASLHRLAPFRPSGVVCLTGPAQSLPPDRARELVVDGLRTLGAEAAGLGLRVGLEPVNRTGGEDWTIVSTISDAVDLIDEAGAPGFGIQFDTWHLWNSETVLDDIDRECDRFVGVHVADWREPTRNWADRVLPGDGVADVPALLGALDAAGWRGYYDLEIFSDNGLFGHSWPESLWDVPAPDLARRGKEAFARAWEARTMHEIITTGRSADETG
jgi:sugar phosphate isomerase/epimerase